nr:polysaccharide deacetylase family protein [Catalinimonas alkaloidigena]
MLTYDDALNIHLDQVIPALDSFRFKGTFYLIAASPVVADRMDDWRAAANEGHELGNHSLNHPCDGTLPGRGFVTPETDLSRYSVARAVNEIRIANTLLKALDGKEERTFAYPCGDLTIGETRFYDSLKDDFVAARGVTSGYPSLNAIDLTDVTAFSQHQTTAAQMIAQIEAAEKVGSLVVFLFHGVGGEHSLNVSREEHRKLLVYLKKRENDLWVAPMVEVAKYIKAQQGASH